MAYTTLNGKLVRVHRNGWTGKTNIGVVIKDNIAATKKAALKGKLDGNCNVTDCQKPGATWWNTSTRAYYCYHCAEDINYWSRHDEGIEICYPSESVAIAAKAPFTEGAW